jgi:antitoxin component YwqK of YwqJK toxin-antitoxin module
MDGTYRKEMFSKVFDEFRSKYKPIHVFIEKDKVYVCNFNNFNNFNNSLPDSKIQRIQRIQRIHGMYKEFKVVRSNYNNNIKDYILLRSGRYYHGLKVGTWRRYFENGHLSEEKKYNGNSKNMKNMKNSNVDEEMLTGYCRNYYSNGTLWNMVFRDKRGQKQGRSISYYNCLDKNFENQLRVECFYRNNVYHGTYRKFYPSGVLEESIDFQNGVMDGWHITYYEDGSLRVQYQNYLGKRHGLYRYWLKGHHFPLNRSYSNYSTYHKCVMYERGTIIGSI